ncbi:hypothetical protein Hanom_Chr15g01401361 [Helianthus anomalus]
MSVVPVPKIPVPKFVKTGYQYRNIRYIRYLYLKVKFGILPVPISKSGYRYRKTLVQKFGTTQYQMLIPTQAWMLLRATVGLLVLIQTGGIEIEIYFSFMLWQYITYTLLAVQMKYLY